MCMRHNIVLTELKKTIDENLTTPIAKLAKRSIKRAIRVDLGYLSSVRSPKQLITEDNKAKKDDTKTSAKSKNVYYKLVNQRKKASVTTFGINIMFFEVEVCHESDGSDDHACKYAHILNGWVKEIRSGVMSRSKSENCCIIEGHSGSTAGIKGLFQIDILHSTTNGISFGFQVGLMGRMTASKPSFGCNRSNQTRSESKRKYRMICCCPGCKTASSTNRFERDNSRLNNRIRQSLKEDTEIESVATDSRGYGISAFSGSQVDLILQLWKSEHVLQTRKQLMVVTPIFFKDRLSASFWGLMSIGLTFCDS
ncbi:unnamed protein product [Lepeophtheirus salmonis]|nr:unnamed protein product [Lepeophtheirus salmonis]CAF2927999.1 unnamed protein product [Lepeophtheirus salmonis]